MPRAKNKKKAYLGAFFFVNFFKVLKFKCLNLQIIIKY